MERAIDEKAAPRRSGASVSVLVLTYNEEANIARCLESVDWSDDVVVLDSFSQDRTVEIAEQYANVRIYKRRFDDFSSQRNHGLHSIEYRNPWLLVLDADETVEPRLAVELRALAQPSTPAQVDAFLVRRKVFIDGRWVRWNTTYGFWIERVMRPDRVRYRGIVHEKLELEGGHGRLKGAIEHHQFTKGVAHWLARRRGYARLEAQRGRAPLDWSAVFSADVLRRRSGLKALFQRLPARWAIYLAFNLVFKAAYLGGIVGLRYVLLETYSHYLVAREMRRHPCSSISGTFRRSSSNTGSPS